MPDNQDFYPIGLVRRDTDTGRITIGTWGRRDGFAELLRSDKDKSRVYGEAQLRRLQRVRQLRDQRLPSGNSLPMVGQALAELERYLLSMTTLPQGATL